MKISINFVPETERQKDMIDTTTIPIDPIDAYNKSTISTLTIRYMASRLSIRW